MSAKILQKNSNLIPTADILSDFIESLQSLTEGAENDFMRIGHGLQAVHANVTDLTGLMLNTGKRIGGDKGGGIITSLDNIANEALQEINMVNEDVNTNLVQINSAVGNIGELKATSRQIKKFAKFLNAVAISMLLENARTVNSENIFSGIAQEIKELSYKITGIANDVYENVEEAEKIHLSIRDKITSGMSRLKKLTLDVHKIVQDSVLEAEQLMGFSLETIEQAGKRSMEISRQVGEIVVGVQFHDNMRQRVMLIIDILKDKDSLSGPVINNQIYALNDVILEVDEVYHKNLTAIEYIEKEVEILVESFFGLKSEEIKDLHGQNKLISDPLYSLKSVLIQLHELLDHGQDLFKQLKEAASHEAGIAEKLTGLLNIISDISSETRNKALNSIIAAQRMGDSGSALKCLAQEVSDLAGKSDVFMDKAASIIETVSVSVTEIGKKGIKCFDTDNRAIDRLDAVIESVSNEYDMFQNDYTEAYERAKGLKKAISSTIVSMEFFKGLSAGLTGQREQLENIAPNLVVNETFHIKENTEQTSSIDDRQVVTPFRDVLQNNQYRLSDEDDFGNNVVIFEDQPPANSRSGKEKRFEIKH
jgi:methyl-accepting chemotaxis protein